VKLEMFVDVQNGKGLPQVLASVQKFVANFDEEMRLEAEAKAEGKADQRMVFGEYGVAVLTQRTVMAQRIHRILRFSARCSHVLSVASENLVDQLDRALGTHVQFESRELDRVVKQLRWTINDAGEVPESGYVLKTDDGIEPSLPTYDILRASAVAGEANMKLGKDSFVGMDALHHLALALREAALAEDTKSAAGMQVGAS
jgi:hypothetical protein